MEIRRTPPHLSVKVAHLEYGIPHKDAEPRHILAALRASCRKPAVIAKSNQAIPG